MKNNLHNVCLVGGGPGARDLITVRGRRALRAASVIFYDDLSNRGLLEEADPAAERIYVGKRQGHKAMAQEEVCRQMVERARAGERVVRLKGGDPFIFGRGGEEAAALAEADVPFEVVPGVSSISAVPAYAGIPLTFRGMAERFEVRTGHGQESTTGRTAVVVMGMKRLEENVATLQREGFGMDLPAAVIQWGTLPQQRSVTGTLGTIVELARDIQSPAVLVVGRVVALGKKLNWLANRPLFGKRVLVTRSRRQAVETCRVLESLGAETITMPTIEIAPPDDPRPLREAIRRVSDYDLLILTSTNAVRALRDTLADLGRDCRALTGVQIACIGPGTAGALRELGLIADLVPEDHRAEGLLALLGEEGMRGKKILLPRALVAREILPQELERRGALLELVTAYQTILPDIAECQGGREALEQGEVDILTFTSASTARNFAKIMGEGVGELCDGKLIVAIGPITRDACLDLGMRVDVMPKKYTLPEMTAALIDHLRTQP